MAADTIAGDIEGLLEGKKFKQTAYALDRVFRKSALALFLRKAEKADAVEEDVVEKERLAA